MRNLLFVILVLLVSGCVVSEEKHQSLVDEVTAMKAEIATMKESIGEWGYIATDPQLSFSIKDVEFAAGEYGSTKISYKADVKQNNPGFKLNNYRVMVYFSVTDKDNIETNTFSQGFHIENGLAALAEIQKIYGNNNFTKAAQKINVDHYEWFPNTSLKPYNSK